MFIIAAGSGSCFVQHLPSSAQMQKTFLHKRIQKAQRALWQKGLEKLFRVNLGNEILLASDSKRAYQLASSHPHLTSLPFLAAASQGLQAALCCFHIHHFSSASIFTTKQLLSCEIHSVWGKAGLDVLEWSPPFTARSQQQHVTANWL